MSTSFVNRFSVWSSAMSMGMVLFLVSTSNLNASIPDKGCYALFKNSLFDMINPDFEQSVLRYPELGSLTTELEKNIAKVEKDRIQLEHLLSNHADRLMPQDIQAIRLMVRLLDYQVRPFNNKTINTLKPTDPEYNLWARIIPGTDGILVGDIIYIWKKLTSVYSNLSDIVKKGVGKEDLVFNISFSLVSFWIKVIERLGSLCLEESVKLYSQNPSVFKIIPDFESRYIKNVNKATPLGLIIENMTSKIRWMLSTVVEQMSTDEYIEFVKLFIAREATKNFFKPDAIYNPRLYSIVLFQELYRPMKLSYRDIMKKFNSFKFDSMADINYVALKYQIVDRIAEKIKFPSSINKDLLTLIISMDMWLTKGEPISKDVLDYICNSFDKLDDFSKIYFITYFVQEYVGKYHQDLVETFSTRVLISSKDELSKKLVKELIIPVLEPYESVGNVLLNAFTSGIDNYLEM